MKLRALDQIHVSSIQPDSLRPGQEIEVGDALGAELLTKHPRTFREVAADEDGGQKADPVPLNKAEDAPANKAVTAGRKTKG